ncbi:Fc.00g076170.m01.CDS01 [Cosmosporella sp. VM-42]
MAKVATDFEKIINEGRERKKNEALADRIFSKNRRQSAPSKLKAPTGPSLASRVGVKKQRNSSVGVRSNPAPGNVNGEWTHDLHHAVNGDNRSLGSRISAPGAKRVSQRTSRLSAAVDRMDTSSDAPKQVNIVKPALGMGLTIRGLAGPFTVMAQNFAPGTTAADIESAMTPIGGEMVSCNIIKTKPIMIVEMAFVSREGGERVIETFNDKTADGRLIKVYPKIGGGYQSPSAAERSNEPPSNAPNGPRSSRPAKNDQIIDGSMGFADLTANGTNGASPKNDRLYSDKLVGGGNGGNRRGRGFQRGRGGR